MNTTNTLVIVIILIILGAAGWFLFSQPNMESTLGDMASGEAMMEKEGGSMMEGDEAMMETADGAPLDAAGDGMMAVGSYEAYAPEKLAKADDGDVVLFFRASWCPTCRALHADIRSHLNAIPGSVTILDVDYDNSTALKQKYGVTYQHTLVQVDAQGNLIKKWMGSPTLAALVGEIN